METIYLHLAESQVFDHFKHCGVNCILIKYDNVSPVYLLV